MSTVTYEFCVGEYVVLRVEPFPYEKFTTIIIDNVSYLVEPTYDLNNCIAIKAKQKDGFLGKVVVFK